MGFLQTGSEGGWRAANTASFKETATQLGLTLKFYDLQNDLANQVAGFRQFIQDPEVNVIILAALETTGWEDVLKEAKDAGKIVVLEDRRIDAPEDLYATYIGSDFAEEGRKGAEEMCKLLEGSSGKVVWELVGNVGSSAAKDRGQGFREGMGVCGITITNSQTGNWSATEGKAVTEAWLKESKDVNGIFAQNDEMGLGAIEALKEAGLVPGKDVMVLTFDATAGAFKSMLAGELNVAVECNPLLAPQVYEAALKAANGEELAQVGALAGRRLPRFGSEPADRRRRTEVLITTGECPADPRFGMGTRPTRTSPNRSLGQGSRGAAAVAAPLSQA